MKAYILFFDNLETGISGELEMSFVEGVDPIPHFFTVIGDSVNPTTTLTLVEI